MPKRGAYHFTDVKKRSAKKMPKLPDEYTYKLLYIHAETEKAICVSVEPHVPYEGRFWLPKSKVEYDEDWKIGDQLEIKIPDWLIMRLEKDGKL